MTQRPGIPDGCSQQFAIKSPADCFTGVCPPANVELCETRKVCLGGEAGAMVVGVEAPVSEPEPQMLPSEYIIGGLT